MSVFMENSKVVKLFSGPAHEHMPDRLLENVACFVESNETGFHVLRLHGREHTTVWRWISVSIVEEADFSVYEHKDAF